MLCAWKNANMLWTSASVCSPAVALPTFGSNPVYQSLVWYSLEHCWLLWSHEEDPLEHQHLPSGSLRSSQWPNTPPVISGSRLLSNHQSAPDAFVQSMMPTSPKKSLSFELVSLSISVASQVEHPSRTRKPWLFKSAQLFRSFPTSDSSIRIMPTPSLVL